MVSYLRYQWGGLRLETYYSQASSVADGTGKLGVAHPLHAALDNGHWSLLLASRSVYIEAGGYIPRIPSARVSSVEKGILKDGN
jgi:hypothetical protein